MNSLKAMILFAVLFFSGPTFASPHLVERISHWPGVSQLIVYDNRLWFVNSEPYEDTNVADIYSYAPDTMSLRYERSLFSQDAGSPVVHQGLLFWPFEDPRSSSGSGEYAVTDGSDWAWRVMQSGSVMHVHAMGVCDDQLVAVTGSWNGQLHRLDANDSWQLQFEYPAGAAPFSRLVSVSQFNNHCLVGASANGQREAKLFNIDGDSRSTMTGWPASDRVEELTPHKSALYAFADSDAGRELLYFNGRKTQTIELPDGHRPRALHSDGELLWLVTGTTKEEDQRGALWIIDEHDGIRRVETFTDTPIDVTRYQNQIFVGTYSRAGGALWLVTDQSLEGSAARVDSTSSLPQRSDVTHTLNEHLVQTLLGELLDLVEDPQSSTAFARELRRQISRHPERLKPEYGAALTRLLDRKLEGEPVTMFTQKAISYQDLVHWYAISALARNGHGRIAPERISRKQIDSDHPGGKLFDPMVAAIVAAGWLKQDDPATINALMQRLNLESNPLWLKADVVGALTAITDQPFGYDIDDWNGWWKNRQ